MAQSHLKSQEYDIVQHTTILVARWESRKHSCDLSGSLSALPHFVRLELRPKVEIMAGRHGAPHRQNIIHMWPITPRLQACNIILTPIRTRRQKVIFPDGVGLDRIGEGNPDKTKLSRLQQLAILAALSSLESRHG